MTLLLIVAGGRIDDFSMEKAPLESSNLPVSAELINFSGRVLNPSANVYLIADASLFNTSVRQ